MTLRDDHIRIRLGRKTIALPSASSVALLEELGRADSMRDVGAAFENSQPPQIVRLTSEQKLALIQLIEQWASGVDGGRAGGLPPGIFELRNALHDDLHDAGND
jgi:hypothetical protein